MIPAVQFNTTVIGSEDEASPGIDVIRNRWPSADTSYENVSYDAENPRPNGAPVSKSSLGTLASNMDSPGFTSTLQGKLSAHFGAQGSPQSGGLIFFSYSANITLKLMLIRCRSLQFALTECGSQAGNRSSMPSATDTTT